LKSGKSSTLIVVKAELQLTKLYLRKIALDYVKKLHVFSLVAKILENCH